LLLLLWGLGNHADPQRARSDTRRERTFAAGAPAAWFYVPAQVTRVMNDDPRGSYSVERFIVEKGPFAQFLEDPTTRASSGNGDRPTSFACK
jgi:hypothetical protein